MAYEALPNHFSSGLTHLTCCIENMFQIYVGGHIQTIVMSSLPQIPIHLLSSQSKLHSPCPYREPLLVPASNESPKSPVSSKSNMDEM